jgi:hypothetical protein
MSVWVGVGLWLIIELACPLDGWLFFGHRHTRTHTDKIEGGLCPGLQNEAFYLGLGVCEIYQQADFEFCGL